MTGAVLMCRPDHFGIEYEINPWMHIAVQVDHALAAAQWDALYRTTWSSGSCRAGPPGFGVARHGFLRQRGRALGRPGGAEQLPPRRAAGGGASLARELERLGFEVHELPRSLSFEGAGDALFVGDRLFCGYGFRTDRATHQPVARILEVDVVSLELVDPRFYHLDTCFCPLDAINVLAAPDAFAPASLRLIRELVPNLIEVPVDVAAGFACNAMPLGRQRGLVADDRPAGGAAARGRVHVDPHADGGVPQGGRRRPVPVPAAGKRGARTAA